jgi:hypothetical protein
MLYVKFEDTTYVYYYAPLVFTKGTHDWQLVQNVHDFGKAIVSVRPYCVLYGGTGTAWFDDVFVAPALPAPKNMADFAQGYIHFWVKTPVDLKIGVRTNNITEGTEQSFVYLSDYSVPADNNWREVYIALDDLKQLDSRIDYTQALVFFNAAVIGEKLGASSGAFWIADVKYVRRKEASPSLSVEIRKRSDNSVDTGGEITLSTASLGAGWTIADQYLKVAYENSEPSWGIQIYTDNMGDAASPKYGGVPTMSLLQQPAGLIGEGEPPLLITCPMAWMVLDDVDTNVPVPSENPNGYPKNDPRYKIFFKSDTNGMWGLEKARGEWSWLKDLESTKWSADPNGNGIPDPAEIVSDFSLTGDAYSTFISSIGIATGWGDIDAGTRVYILNTQSPIVLYLAATFKIARELRKYKTNTITLELYHY